MSNHSFSSSSSLSAFVSGPIWICHSQPASSPQSQLLFLRLWDVWALGSSQPFGDFRLGPDRCCPPLADPPAHHLTTEASSVRLSWTAKLRCVLLRPAEAWLICSASSGVRCGVVLKKPAAERTLHPCLRRAAPRVDISRLPAPRHQVLTAPGASGEEKHVLF